mmetsp:Transcript_91842/g.233565  ORF Transcript_91842/g.233565 Transcript_91842/m.233565 type:complete len:85 (-) Transcript_91842:78-332(-)
MIIELEEKFEDMLERMHDVEEAIGSICKSTMPSAQMPFAPKLFPRSATASFLAAVWEEVLAGERTKDVFVCGRHMGLDGAQQQQ